MKPVVSSPEVCIEHDEPELSAHIHLHAVHRGPALVIAATGYASINALGRNPSAAPKILTAMTITLIFAEAVAIIAFLVVWQLFTK